jgi:diaminopimelate epimerase
MQASQAATGRGSIVSEFVKYEAMGNDYLVIDPARSPVPVTPESVVALCDRRRGIGADGVLWGPFVEDGAIRLRIFNSDGSECRKSGNGLRIFAHYVRMEGYVGHDEFVVETPAGPSWLKVLDFDTGAGILKVGLGAPSFDSAGIPAAGPRREIVNERIEADGEGLAITCVNNGNPHCVLFGDEISPERMKRLGPAISGAPVFPKGINVGMARILDRHSLRAEIWERGAGYVSASGSGACAIACVAHALGHVGPDVTVQMPGGTVSVSVSPSGEVFLTGEVRQVAVGMFGSKFREHLMSHASPAAHQH